MKYTDFYPEDINVCSKLVSNLKTDKKPTIKNTF